MQKLNDLKQGTKEWHDFRSLGIGGSDIACITGTSPYKTAYVLWTEKTKQAIASSTVNWAMKRGTDNEPIARDMVESLTGKIWPPELFVKEAKPHLRVSLDGISGDEILEIKVPSEKLVTAIEVDGIAAVPAHYMDQMQYQLLVTDTKRCLFVCFHPERNKISSLWIDRDQEHIDRLEKLADAFWNCVETKTAPELSDKDFIEVSAQSFIDDAKTYSDLHSSIKVLEMKLDAVKERILDQAKGHPAIRGGGLRVLGYSVKGTIDYTKIEALKFIDVEQYRKPSRQQFKITIEKTK
jgi:putative phage-type endonuclease